MSLEIIIWDVQHGSASYVRTPNGKHIAIDLGTGSLTQLGPFSPLLHLRDRYGVTQLDKVVITHPHRDHISDIFNFSALSPRILRRPAHLTEAAIAAGNDGRIGDRLRRYLDISAYYSAPVPEAKDPEIAANNGGVEVATFGSMVCPPEQLNNHSLVTFFAYANSTICIPGDNEEPSWHDLLQSPSFRQMIARTDVLIAPHHGRRAGYCVRLFENCHPSLVIVSDGPETDTAAIVDYRSHTSGWRVWSRSSGESDTRYVLTTRRDGVIRVRCFWEETTAVREVTIA